MQIPDQNLWIAAGTVVVPLVFSQWMMHRANMKAGKARDQKLDFVLGEHMPHSHTEGPGQPLCETGIRYPKVRFNGGNGR
jgi:hypothetical protein